MPRSKQEEQRTTLDSDVTRPSVTQPGDGPADTTDPNKRASSVIPRPGEEALRVGTVNAVLPVEQPAAAAREGEERVETYEATRPDGSTVTVTHNIETGESQVK
jgi:hypothetical protein